MGGDGVVGITGVRVKIDEVGSIPNVTYKIYFFGY